MIIIWRGKGILAAIIPIALAFITAQIFKESTIAPSIVAIIAGSTVLWLGKKWNKRPSGVAPHSLFWIPMEYWGMLSIVLGAALLLPDMLAEIVFKGGIISLIGFIIYKTIVNYKAQKPSSEQQETPQKPLSKLELRKQSILAQKKTGNTHSPSISNKTIQELKENRGKEKKIEPSDHQKYLPK